MYNTIKIGFTCATQLPRIYDNSESSDESGYKTSNSVSSRSASGATLRGRQSIEHSDKISNTKGSKNNLEDMVKKIESLKTYKTKQVDSRKDMAKKTENLKMYKTKQIDNRKNMAKKIENLKTYKAAQVGTRKRLQNYASASDIFYFDEKVLCTLNTECFEMSNNSVKSFLPQ